MRLEGVRWRVENKRGVDALGGCLSWPFRMFFVASMGISAPSLSRDSFQLVEVLRHSLHVVEKDLLIDAPRADQRRVQRVNDVGGDDNDAAGSVHNPVEDVQETLRVR